MLLVPVRLEVIFDIVPYVGRHSRRVIAGRGCGALDIQYDSFRPLDPEHVDLLVAYILPLSGHLTVCRRAAARFSPRLGSRLRRPDRRKGKARCCCACGEMRTGALFSALNNCTLHWARRDSATKRSCWCVAPIPERVRCDPLVMHMSKQCNCHYYCADGDLV